MKATLNKFFTDIKEFDTEEYNLDIESKPGVFEEKPRDIKGMILIVDNYTTYNVQELIDKIKKGIIVIVNMNSFSKDEKIKIYDYLVGAMYSLNGHLKTIDSNVIMCTPIGYYYEN